MFHKVKNVYPLENYKLLVRFYSGITKIYDVKPLFEWKDIFKTLKENDLFYVKAGLVAFVSMFFIYSALFNEVEYAIYYTLYQPIFMTGPFMICLFIFTYVISKGKEKKEEVKEVTADE